MIDFGGNLRMVEGFWYWLMTLIVVFGTLYFGMVRFKDWLDSFWKLSGTNLGLDW